MYVRALTLGIATALLAQPAVGELWVWTDPDGVVRYTSHVNRIPEKGRASALRVEPGMQLPAVPPGPGETAAAGAPALYAPPGEISFATDPFNAPEQARSLAVDVIAEPEDDDPWRTPVESKQPATATAGAAGASPSASAAAPAAPRSPPAIAPTPAAAVAATAVAAPRANEPARPPRVLTSDQKQRKAEIERLIERDQDALKTLISDADAVDLENSAALREIAQRLPELQAELRALERGEPAPTETAR